MQSTPQVPAYRVPRAFIWLSLFSVVLLGIIVAALLLLRGRPEQVVFSDLISPAVDLLASGLLFVAAKASAQRSRRLALGWGTIALALLLYAVGDVIWGVLELGLKEAPFPSLADLFYLVYYPAFLVGVYLLIVRPPKVRSVVHDALDLAIILGTALLGYWNLLIGPTLASSAGAPLPEQIILAAYPVGDLVLLGALLLILYNDPGPESLPSEQGSKQDPAQSSIPVFLLGAGLLMTIVGDSTYTYQALVGTYVSGGLLDTTWLAANLVICMAGAAQWAALQPGSSMATYQPGPVFRAWAARLKAYLPYVLLLGAFALLVAGALRPLPMSLFSVALGVGLILAMVLVRQYLTLAENQQLNTRLKSQAARLESANRDLNLEIAERLRVQEQLAFDVLHDQMTGLANRRLFLDRLGQALKRSHRHPGVTFAVLFMDLDQFKVVNDSLGHSLGDQLLISLSRRLNEALRSEDSIARFGGDEFAILLDDLQDEQTARLLAEKVQDVITEPFRLKDRDVHITASIGIATDAIKYDHPDDLLRDVDLAMYQAKALGRARYTVFRPDMRDQAFSRLAMEEGLRKGLESGEFQLYYQPIRSLESDRVVGLEALLRWCHPSKGLLLPAEFLAVAEESDLILPIGDWVLNEACRQMRAWQDHYAYLETVAVNVNISNKEFAQPDLVGKIASALRASGLKGSSLTVEITERVLVENYPTANSVIAALHDMDVQVQIDDFGTGYSALAYLQQFPINAIKIDKSFINEMRTSRKGLGLVRAIVSMARELGMETIAEGIETGEQLSELRGLLCGFGQGFLLSRPLDAASAERVLADMEA